jgi:hypothetical protein
LAITISSVIIDDLNVVGFPFDPTEAHPPLVIDPEAMLSPPVTRQCLEAIPRRGLEIAQGARPVKVVQLPARHPLDRRKRIDVLRVRSPSARAAGRNGGGDRAIPPQTQTTCPVT